MGTGYLVDSNAIIDLVLGRLPVVAATWLDQCIGQGAVSLSVITRIELLTKTQPADEYQPMQALTNSVRVLPLGEPVIQQTIRLRQSAASSCPTPLLPPRH
jgi:predicted nucleic acid-binding protein